jgi:hypothetical protein
MATRNITPKVRATSAANRLSEKTARNPDNWPVIWRVTAPACASYGRDWIFVETECEAEARRVFHASRCGGYPVRLERVQCGPLPEYAPQALKQLFDAHAQTAGAAMRVSGHWTVQT